MSSDYRQQQCQYLLWIGLTQMFTGVVAADLHYGNNIHIHRITSFSAILLQSQGLINCSNALYRVRQQSFNFENVSNSHYIKSNVDTLLSV